MGWNEFFSGLEMAMGPLAGLGVGMATGNPLAGIGVAASMMGPSLAARGTATDVLGPSDEEIAAMLAQARSARSADIRSREDRAQRQLASQAAQGGTLGSGLHARGVGDINQAAGLESAGMEADLARMGLQALSSRQYVPRVNALGRVGQSLSAFGTPLMMLGLQQVLGAPAAAAGAGAAGGRQIPMGFTTGGGWEKMGTAGSPWPGQGPLGQPFGAQPFAQAQQGLQQAAPQAAAPMIPYQNQLQMQQPWFPGMMAGGGQWAQQPTGPYGMQPWQVPLYGGGGAWGR